MNLESIGFPLFKYQAVELPENPLQVCFKRGDRAFGNIYLWNTFSLQKMPSVWGACFYTEDWRFGRFLKDVKVAQLYLPRFKYVIQPDFSVYYDQPLIDQWWRTWTGKRIAATWQKNGIKVIPSLVAGSRDNYEAAVFGWQPHQVFAVQVQANDHNPTQDETDAWTITKALHDFDPPFVLVYATKDRLEKLGLNDPRLKIINSKISALRAF